MLEMYFIACLAAKHCEEKSIVYSDVNELTCITKGQAEIAQWRIVHPGWTITRYGCRPAGLMSKA